MDEPQFTLLEALVLIQVGFGGLQASAIEYQSDSGLCFGFVHRETNKSFDVVLNRQGQIVDGCDSTRTIAQITGRMNRGFQNPLAER